MQKLFLVKYGEIALKGRNREAFEKRLAANIRRKVGRFGARVRRSSGRLYVHIENRCAEDKNRLEESVLHALESTFGVVAFSSAVRCQKDVETIDRVSLELARQFREQENGGTFKVEARRTDKGFPLNSYEIACRLGELVRTEHPGLMVDVRAPQWVLNVEIREQAFLYGPEFAGPGGLPLGAAGRGVLLLSGGIDSPVSGYLMGKRGLDLQAVYFHAHPFTSPQAKKKVITIAEILSRFFPSLRLNVVPFTDIQIRIKERASHSHTTLLMRACMVSIAERIAKRIRAVCLVTGESLGQVASQTPQSIRFTGSFTDLPIFRPLIGMDKEEITRIARKIGTYETSILPYPDCCTVFSPRDPVIKPVFQTMVHAYEALEIEPLLDQAIESMEIVDAGN